MLCSFDFTIIMISDKIGLTVSEYTCHQSIWQPWVGYSAILRDDRTWARLPYSSTYHSGLRKFSFFILCPYKCFLWIFCISSPPLFFSVHSLSSFDLLYRRPIRSLQSMRGCPAHAVNFFPPTPTVLQLHILYPFPFWNRIWSSCLLLLLLSFSSEFLCNVIPHRCGGCCRCSLYVLRSSWAVYGKSVLRTDECKPLSSRLFHLRVSVHQAW